MNVTHSDEKCPNQPSDSREPREFGFIDPIIIDGDKNIVAGHGRVEAAKGMGMTSVPCIIISGLTKEQVRAYVIADNKLALNAEWNDEVLRMEMQGIIASGFDLTITGFTQIEIDDQLATEAIQKETEEILHEQSLQMDPAKEYLIITAADAEAGELTEKQSAVLERAGFDKTAFKCRGEASQYIDRIVQRRQSGLATPKQLKWLIKFKHPSPQTATFEEATAFLDLKFGVRKPAEPAAA